MGGEHAHPGLEALEAYISTSAPAGDKAMLQKIHAAIVEASQAAEAAADASSENARYCTHSNPLIPGTRPRKSMRLLHGLQRGASCSSMAR